MAKQRNVYLDGGNVPQDVPQENIDAKIIQMMKENPKVTTEQMAKVLGIASKTVKRHISAMPNVSYIGRGYSGHWEVDDE